MDAFVFKNTTLSFFLKTFVIGTFLFPELGMADPCVNICAELQDAGGRFYTHDTGNIPPCSIEHGVIELYKGCCCLEP